MWLGVWSRIKAKNLTITRFSGAVARYTIIQHRPDFGNPASRIGYLSGFTSVHILISVSCHGFIQTIASHFLNWNKAVKYSRQPGQPPTRHDGRKILLQVGIRYDTRASFSCELHVQISRMSVMGITLMLMEFTIFHHSVAEWCVCVTPHVDLVLIVCLLYTSDAADE